MAETILETARLRLRTWDRADIDPFMAHLNTPSVTRWLGGTIDHEQCRAMIDRMLVRQASTGHCFWVAEAIVDGATLGYCGLQRGAPAGSPVEGKVELGWRLREDVWHRGYAAEAARACIEWGRANLSDQSLLAYTVPGNVPSWSLMEKIGMTRRPDLDFDHPEFPQGHELCRHIVYGIDRPGDR